MTPKTRHRKSPDDRRAPKLNEQAAGHSADESARGTSGHDAHTTAKAQGKPAAAIDKRIGGRIRLRRELMKFTQYELAERAGLSRDLVVDYEGGRVPIEYRPLKSIATVLDTPMEYFGVVEPESISGDDRQARKSDKERAASEIRDRVKTLLDTVADQRWPSFDEETIAIQSARARHELAVIFAQEFSAILERQVDCAAGAKAGELALWFREEGGEENLLTVEDTAKRLGIELNAWRGNIDMEHGYGGCVGVTINISNLIDNKEALGYVYSTMRETKSTLQPNDNAVGEAIKRARLEAGLTQTELAARLRTEQTNVAKLEGGRWRPSLDMLQRIADATGQDLTVPFRPTARPHRRAAKPTADR